ncbi:7-carboxy-7-deazaguanine synthase QueE [Streptomyces sp. NPDC002851]
MTGDELPLAAAEPALRGETHLPVNEVFWDVVQGEGPYTGRACAFIRLGLCNLHCPPCDTAQTWDTSRFDLGATCPDTAVDEVVGRLPHTVRLVVISGGEPLIWQQTSAFSTLLTLLEKRDIAVHVETNGTIGPLSSTAQHVAHFSVSPKLTAMGGADPEKRRIKPNVIAAFADLASQGRACFKFVVADESHVDEVVDFTDRHLLDRAWVWVMPEAGDTQTLLARQPGITDAAAREGVNVSTRLHVIARCR